MAEPCDRGILNRTLQCGPTIAPYTGWAQAINDAIQSCAPGRFVSLGSWTFTLWDGITFTVWDPNNFVWVVKNNVTLRGAGPDQTKLKFTGGVDCGALRTCAS
jgi:hypothetical protein